MKISDLAKCDWISPINIYDPDREISGAYTGDLLSWVMGRAECGNAWITIMSNINTVAVATLVDVSCIIMAENVTPDDECLVKCREKGVNVLSSSFSAFKTSVELSKLI